MVIHLLEPQVTFDFVNSHMFGSRVDSVFGYRAVVKTQHPGFLLLVYYTNYTRPSDSEKRGK